jgi:hypothetical protein
MMLCPRCGAQIPDDSAKCPQCRAQIAVTNTTLAATDVSRDLPQQEKRIRAVLAAGVLCFALGWIAWVAASHVRQFQSSAPHAQAAASRQTIPVVQSPVQLRMGAPVSIPFSVPSGCQSPVLESRFEAVTETGAAAPLMTVFDEAAYAAWKNRQPSRAVYSARMRPGTSDLALPATSQRYVLVFSTSMRGNLPPLQTEVQLHCVQQ